MPSICARPILVLLPLFPAALGLPACRSRASLDAPVVEDRTREASQVARDGRPADQAAAPEPPTRTATASPAPPATASPAPPATAETIPGAGRGAVVAGGHAGTESYAHLAASDWTSPREDPLSTFAVDVDTGSYTIFRKKVLAGAAVPPDAIRVEELVNYFHYDDAPPAPGSDAPFAVHAEVAPSPWSQGRAIMRIGLKGRELSPAERAPANLVFLVDVSGSMDEPDKLPLVKQALGILVDSLDHRDSVSLVTYAGTTGVALERTGLDQRSKILRAIADLDAGGSTAMGSGLDLAYQQASRGLRPDAISRVIVLTDGDANVGPSSFEELLSIIAGRAREGVTLSCIGFGMGNYKDSLLEQLADKGNGNYYYVDGAEQARRIFHDQLIGTLQVIAQDAKVQVEMDPRAVARYRLVGYENRDVADEQFRNDEVDGGEIGSGHAVTALYELELRAGAPGPLATVRVRAARPGTRKAGEWTTRVGTESVRRRFDDASADLRFATAVMGAAEILRGSRHAAGWDLARARDLARAAAGDSDERAELVRLLTRVLADRRTILGAR